MIKKQKQEEFKQSALDIVAEKEYKKMREREEFRRDDGGAGELAKVEKVVEQAKNENYKQVDILISACI